MEKHYTKLKKKMIGLLLIAVLFLCGIMTIWEAITVLQEYKDRAYNYTSTFSVLRSSKWEENVSETDFLKNVYETYGKVSEHGYKMGFYSMTKNAARETLAESGNILIVSKHTKEDTIDRRILLLDKVEDEDTAVKLGYKEWEIGDVEIYGSLDELYIYPERVELYDHFREYKGNYIPEKTETHLGTETFENWAGSNGTGLYSEENFYYIDVYPEGARYKDWEKSIELNEEAEQICNQVYEDCMNGNTLDDHSKMGLFTAYVARTGYSDEYWTPYVFVFHPLELAMENLLGIYLLVGVVTLIFVGVISSTTQRLQLQQETYENNRRQLTRGVAHELKTPLAIVKGYVENWQYMDEADREKNSKTIISEIENMDTLVSDLLELSRLEANAKEIHLESVDVYALTKTVVRRMDSILKERNLSLRIIPETLWEEEQDKYLVEADLEMLRTVIVNLVSNAIKYSEENISIDLSVSDKNIKFSITNDGRKIEDTDRIWDEFYRDNRTDKSRIGSSGIGLAIVKNILSLHHGKYGCTSEEGQTTFWFELKTN